jgi:hypothetical protein
VFKIAIVVCNVDNILTTLQSNDSGNYDKTFRVFCDLRQEDFLQIFSIGHYKYGKVHFRENALIRCS